MIFEIYAENLTQIRLSYVRTCTKKLLRIIILATYEKIAIIEVESKVSHKLRNRIKIEYVYIQEEEINKTVKTGIFINSY
ncbi:unnamed protein product [Xylocopa violacea]|uniref:Uncharacterized protein n=1 Tax=Xylocopa violacea TaxID=135666 RepID=A0ABP1P8H7_XYLVO